jgi:hypothetical protein
MSNSLFGKVEALMRKHRGDSTTQTELPAPTERQAPPADAWLPVLTDVIKRGSPPLVAEVAHANTEKDVTEPSSVAPVLDETHVPPTGEARAAPVETLEPPLESVTEPEPTQTAVSAIESSTGTKLDEQVAENLVDELTPRISGLMQEQVAEELRKSLNQSMASLMANLNANVEEMVRQAVAEKLAEKDKKPN